MLERGLLGGVPYTQAIANRPALPQDDRLMAVFSGWRRREGKDVPGLDLFHDLFKSECRDVMALVHCASAPANAGTGTSRRRPVHSGYSESARTASGRRRE